jgi:hypothetical protein
LVPRISKDTANKTPLYTSNHVLVQIKAHAIMQTEDFVTGVGVIYETGFGLDDWIY